MNPNQMNSAHILLLTHSRVETLNLILFIASLLTSAATNQSLAGDLGKDVVPNLATIRQWTPEPMLINILDPNREVAPNFVGYIIETSVTSLEKYLSGSKNPVHPLRQVAGGFDVRRLVGGLLGDRPALITRAVQGSHDPGPVGVAVEQFGARARPGERCRRLGAEILDVDSHDSFAEHLNPSLGRTVIAAHVADVEMPAHPLATEAGKSRFVRSTSTHHSLIQMKNTVDVFLVAFTRALLTPV